VNAQLTRSGTTVSASREDIVAAIGAGQFFWLDLDDGDPNDGDAVDLLLHTFHFHPLAVEDAEHFGQRPKLDEYDGFDYLVAHGAAPDGACTIEVHLFITGKYVVTVHRGHVDALDDVRERIGRHPATDGAPPQIILTYLIVDSLTDTFFPALSTFDDKVDTLETQILARPTEEQLDVIFQMKRTLMAIRKVVTPQRDMFAAVTSGAVEVPGMTDESARYFRDLYDHLIRISDLVDSYRDLLSGVMDTHISTVSNRLNVVMKQLTIIATIFLPLSFLTGFFGQNFGWLVVRITGFWAFMVWGIGLELVAVALLYVLFKRRGWLGGPAE